MIPESWCLIWKNRCRLRAWRGSWWFLHWWCFCPQIRSNYPSFSFRFSSPIFFQEILISRWRKWGICDGSFFLSLCLVKIVDKWKCWMAGNNWFWFFNHNNWRRVRSHYNVSVPHTCKIFDNSMKETYHVNLNRQLSSVSTYINYRSALIISDYIMQVCSKQSFRIQC